MGKTISKETIQKISELYSQTKNQQAVAKELGISVSTVRKYLQLSETSNVISERKPRVKITPELVEKINELYEKTLNMAEVGRQLNISSATVRAHLSEENLKKKDSAKDDFEALFYYIYRLFGEYSKEQPISPWNITQIQRFKAKGMTYKGQLLTLKYFYEIRKHTTEKSNGSIGIISYVYGEAAAYYQAEASRAEDVAKAIQKQLEKDRLEINIDPSQYINRKGKKKIDLNSIGDD